MSMAIDAQCDQGTPLLSAHALQQWRGLPFQYVRSAREGAAQGAYCPGYWLAVVLRGHAEATLHTRLRRAELQFSQARFAGYPKGRHWDHVIFTGQVDVATFLITPEAVAQALPAADIDELQPTNIPAVACGHDPALAAIVQAMADEVRHGCPSGALYAQGLSVALLSRLRSSARAPACSGPGSGKARPSAAAISRVMDHIEAHLDSDLSIASLSRLAGLGPSAFCAGFRAVSGMPVHQYVLSRRIQRSVELLRTGMGLAEVALACGFSSQSRFTEAFRQQLGDTPARYRRRQFSLAGPLSAAG